MNCWNLLGISADSSRKEVKKAYSKLLKVTHPEDDAVAFQALSEAYQMALSIAAHNDNKLNAKDRIAPPISAIQGQRITFLEDADTTIKNDNNHPSSDGTSVKEPIYKTTGFDRSLEQISDEHLKNSIIISGLHSREIVIEKFFEKVNLLCLDEENRDILSVWKKLFYDVQLEDIEIKESIRYGLLTFFIDCFQKDASVPIPKPEVIRLASKAFDWHKDELSLANNFYSADYDKVMLYAFSERGVSTESIVNQKESSSGFGFVFWIALIFLLSKGFSWLQNQARQRPHNKVNEEHIIDQKLMSKIRKGTEDCKIILDGYDGMRLHSVCEILAKQNDKNANFWLGVEALYSTNHQKDISVGLDYLEQASKLGDTDAAQLLGYEYQLEGQSSYNPIKSSLFLDKAIYKNTANARYLKATMMILNRHQASSKLEDLLQPMLDRQEKKAFWLLADASLYGLGVNADTNYAVKWLNKLVEMGDLEQVNKVMWRLATSDINESKGITLALEYEHFFKAPTLTKNHKYLDTLAAAYARANQYQNAAIFQNMAIMELKYGLKKNEPSKIMDQYLVRLNSYKQHKPTTLRDINYLRDSYRQIQENIVENAIRQRVDVLDRDQIRLSIFN